MAPPGARCLAVRRPSLCASSDGHEDDVSPRSVSMWTEKRESMATVSEIVDMVRDMDLHQGADEPQLQHQQQEDQQPRVGISDLPSEVLFTILEKQSLVSHRDVVNFKLAVGGVLPDEERLWRRRRVALCVDSRKCLRKSWTASVPLHVREVVLDNLMDTHSVDSANVIVRWLEEADEDEAASEEPMASDDVAVSLAVPQRRRTVQRIIFAGFCSPWTLRIARDCHKIGCTEIFGVGATWKNLERQRFHGVDPERLFAAPPPGPDDDEGDVVPRIDTLQKFALAWPCDLVVEWVLRAHRGSLTHVHVAVAPRDLARLRACVRRLRPTCLVWIALFWDDRARYPKDMHQWALDNASALFAGTCQAKVIFSC